MKLSKKQNSKPFPIQVENRLDQESVDFFKDDEISEPSQLQFKSTKISQAEIESDRASINSSAHGSSSSCEERDRLKNPRSNPNYLKATSSSEKKKMSLLVSDVTDSETSSVGFDENKSVLRNTKSKSSPSFKRNTSMRTLKILMSKPKKGSCLQVPEGEGVIRPTCSSAIKDSKVPLVEVEPEERESEKVSALRVCRYTYCSLHGHHSHSSVPSLKRVLSKRRRFSKTQKGVKTSNGDSIEVSKSSQLVVKDDSKGRKKGKVSKVVASKSRVKVAKGFESSESMSEHIDNADVAKQNEAGNGKKKQMSLWYLIHKQMVSGLADELDNQEMKIREKVGKNSEKGNEEIGVRDLETQKMYATKVVREAIEKILLPEIPDQSPDDVSISSDAPSEQEKQNPSEDPQEQVGKAKNEAPNKWSNLKKLILLKRFVKELEKVKKISPRETRVLPTGTDQESEKVSLRSKGLDRKKSTEEWMLDYALQQAVCELAVTQKRKVELLIKAFEIVVPSIEGEHSPLSFTKFKGIGNERDNNEDKKSSSVGDDGLNVLVEGKANQEDEISMMEQSQEVSDVISSRSEDDNEEILVANGDGSSISDSSSIDQFTMKEEVNVREFSLMESSSQKLEINEVPLDNDPNHVPIIDSETEKDPLQAFKSKFTKPKNMSMWNLIHQEMVAGLADEVKPQEIENKSKNEECDEIENQEVELRKVFAIKMVREAIEKILLPEVDDQSTTSETVSEQDLIEKKQDEDWGSHIFNSFGASKEEPTHCSTNKFIYDISLTQEELAFGSAQKPSLETEKKETKLESKAEKKAPKRWSNLKKWIVLQRFVKALEKVKDFNPKKPQLLPLKLDPEGEVVRLRNQMMNEKRSSEEWMLDYALRKVVSELAPKQKKKVELLVKAFETVVPPTEEMKSPVMFPRIKGTESVKKLKNIFATKIDDGNKGFAITDEKSDVVSRSPFRDTKLDGLVSGSSREHENKIFGLKSIGKLTNTAQSDKQKHMKMWHLLCQHVVSEIAVKVEDQDDVSPRDSLTVDQEKDNEDPTVGFSKSDAVKLVKEAIDEILVPDIQDDSSDTLSIASDMSHDQDLLEEKKPRNWDKLKKMILLKRSIKALEKARRSNQQAPRHQPSESGQEVGKAPRHRLSDERKKAEDWMLDYAVQHIVTKLTPARKRRVSMLVEAFEAVVPLPQN